jgi:hypothetical protein
VANVNSPCRPSHATPSILVDGVISCELLPSLPEYAWHFLVKGVLLGWAMRNVFKHASEMRVDDVSLTAQEGLVPAVDLPRAPQMFRSAFTTTVLSSRD